MRAYLLKRLGASALTLLLLSLIVFLACQVLPGDPARAILGREAPVTAVDALNRQLGLDQPLPAQYWNWISKLPQGDLGRSYRYSAPVGDFLWPALDASVRLAALTFVILVPLAVLGGVIAAFNRGNLVDRVISVAGLSLATVPEFVSGILLILVFAIQLKWLPVGAQAGGSFLSMLPALVLPAVALTFVLFGYIARMARAGTIEALNSDYVRTATLKGLPRRTVVFRHVLRNSLAPTITVIATQFGGLVSGLVVIETLFNYPGLGRLIYTAAQTKDFPVLLSGTLLVGAVYLLATFVADVLYTVLNPRLRLQGSQ
jgi:peptide/nickel transport system permease protein